MATAISIDSYAINEDGLECERCNARPVFAVGGTTLTGESHGYCKSCIRLLNSFPDLYYKIRCAPGVVGGLTIERGDARLVAWLQQDQQEAPASQ